MKHSLEQKNNITPITDIQNYCIHMAQFLESKKAVAVCVFDTRIYNTVSEYSIIASTGSLAHQKALTTFLIEECTKLQIKPLNRIEKANPWVLIDFDFVCVHIFLKEWRHFYNLEGLWKGADIVYGDVVTSLEKDVKV